MLQYFLLENCFFMCTTIVEFIVNFKLTFERVCRNEWPTFRSFSTDHDHALVVCDLTQILLQILITHWLSVTWPRYFYRSWSRIGCLWLDPDTSTDLDHALVVCDLTQILAEYRYLGQVTDNQWVIKICRRRSKRCSFVSANSLKSKFKVCCHFDSCSCEQYIP